MGIVKGFVRGVTRQVTRRSAAVIAAALVGIVVTGVREGFTLDKVLERVGISPAIADQIPGEIPRERTRGPYPVLRVIDGDTIIVDNEDGSQRVRLIGINTPETVRPHSPVQCYGKEASDYAKTTLTGTSVFLEEDPTQDTRDRYGRRLAYVWTSAGTLFNLTTIQNGYAFEYT